MIRRARRDGREARGNEERQKREDEKGSHCFFKSSGYDKLELKHQNLVFSSLWNALLKKKICHSVKQKIEVFILGGQRIDQKRNKGWWRERIEKRSRERIEIERKETKGN